MNRVDELANMDAEAITAILVEGQKKILADMLDKGIPLTYRNENGQMVREYPDGRIEPVKRGGNADIDNGMWS